MRIPMLSLLTILCLALSTTAFAGQFYSDGPTDGTTNGFFIDGPGGPFGQTISDGFLPPPAALPAALTSPSGHSLAPARRPLRGRSAASTSSAATWVQAPQVVPA